MESRFRWMHCSMKPDAMRPSATSPAKPMPACSAARTWPSTPAVSLWPLAMPRQASPSDGQSPLPWSPWSGRSPRRAVYFLAKGGITSSDLATQGLDVRRAMVLGQIHSGVPVWQLGPKSRHPALPYIVFPGNVGDDQALAKVVRRLRNDK